MSGRFSRTIVVVLVLFTLTFGFYKALSISTVTVSAALLAPVANNDSYVMQANTTLVVTAPGVLVNDSGVTIVDTVPIDDPLNGTVNINFNGGFSYTPNPG